MNRIPLAAAIALAWTGCAGPPAPAGDPAAIEQARRDERERIMRDTWAERTLAPDPTPAGRGPPRIAYPAGTYSGIRFGPRSAPDPSLADPVR